MLRGLTAVSNPILYYKLDPGEMGIAAPASASQSVLRVASHELGNIHRFEAEAMEKGGIVIYENIYLNRQFVGSFLAARSGESKAYIIFPKHKKVNTALPKNKETNGNTNHIDAKKVRTKRLKERIQREIQILSQKLQEEENNPAEGQKAERLREKIRNLKSILIRIELAQNNKALPENINPLPGLVGSGFDAVA